MVTYTIKNYHPEMLERLSACRDCQSIADTFKEATRVARRRFANLYAR